MQIQIFSCKININKQIGSDYNMYSNLGIEDEVMEEIIVDADILLNNWYTPFTAGSKKIKGIRTLENTRLYLSLSNFHYMKVLAAQTVSILETTHSHMKASWVLDHRTLLALLRDENINKLVVDFSKDNNNFSKSIMLNKVDLELVLFKGYNIDMSNFKNGHELAPTIDETVAFANYKLQQGKHIPVLVGNKLLQEFATDYNIEMQVRLVR